jgi:hypothetical protein
VGVHRRGEEVVAGIQLDRVEVVGEGRIVRGWRRRGGGRESRGEGCDDWTRRILKFVLVEQRTRLEYVQVSRILAEGLHLVVGGHRDLQVAPVALPFALSQQGPDNLAHG